MAIDYTQYVELNGIRSTLIRGLMIQKLPPISKPLMRTEVEEIDGRDGDIITELGYSAYNRELLIGLYEPYDIDEVIEFFSSEGEAVFSNEHDKKYRYKIIEQIDFEKLIRFRTATVTFHVQPFKYSSIDRALTVTNQLIGFQNYTETNGYTVQSRTNGIISIKGGGVTSTSTFTVPISTLGLREGSYTLNVYADGLGALGTVRLIRGTSPTNPNSFGGQALSLVNGETSSVKADVFSYVTYNALYFSLPASQSEESNFTVYIGLENNEESTMRVVNLGNILSKPKITINGTGSVKLYVNGYELFNVNIGNERNITIDSELMEAYKDTPDNLMNRRVTGDYNRLVLPKGRNQISWSGNVSEVSVENYSRWI